MRQIISQHGWGLDQNIWMTIKHQFIKNHWLWQDNERGYFSDPTYSAVWVKDNSDKSIRIALCHSLGIHLFSKNILAQATHIVLINSFNNFIPNNNEYKLTTRTLNRMEKKINDKEVNHMLSQFLIQSFMPNKVDKNFLTTFRLNSKNIKLNLLSIDFRKLYRQRKYENLFSKNTDVLIIKSKNDSILKEYACNEFIDILNNLQINKPKLVELDKQGHILTNIDIVKIIEEWIESLDDGL